MYEKCVILCAWRADRNVDGPRQDEHGETVAIGTQAQSVALQFIRASIFLIFNDLF